MKANEKRKSRSYKAVDTEYNDAMKRAKKEKTTLAQRVEQFVSIYASGAKSFKFFKEKIT